MLHSFFAQENLHEQLSEVKENNESEDWAPEKKLAFFQTVKIAKNILQNSEEHNETKDIAR